MKQKQKNKILIFFLISLFGLLLTACAEEKKNESFYIIEDKVELPEEETDTSTVLVADTTLLKLYYPDETGQFILTKVTDVEEINEDTITEQINRLEYLENPIDLLRLTGEVDKNGSLLINAEFYSNLSAEVLSLDERKQQIVYACLVNTILNAYNAGGVQIQVGSALFPFMGDGELVPEGQELLPDGYYGRFPLSFKETRESVITVNGHSEAVQYVEFYSEEGYRVFYEEDTYVYDYDQEQEMVIFDKKETNTSFVIYQSEYSRTDTVEELLSRTVHREEELSSETVYIGADAYEAVAVFFSGVDQVINYYVLDNNGRTFVIEVIMDTEAESYDGTHIGAMLDTFQMIH